MSGVSVLSSARHLLVIQPLVGIGDMIWHKPWIDHLARTHKVTLMTKPSVQADVIFERRPGQLFRTEAGAVHQGQARTA